MDKYHCTSYLTPQSVDENEMRVIKNKKIGSYIPNAIQRLKQNQSPLNIKAMGRVIQKAIILAEILKRKVAGLHQITEFGSVECIDHYEPIEEGLDSVEVVRQVGSITIILSLQPLDNKSPGYQPPLLAELVSTENQSKRDNQQKSKNKTNRNASNKFQQQNMSSDKPNGRSRNNRRRTGNSFIASEDQQAQRNYPRSRGRNDGYTKDRADFGGVVKQQPRKSSNQPRQQPFRAKNDTATQQPTAQSQPSKQPVVQQSTTQYQPKKQPTNQSQPKKQPVVQQPTSHYQSKKEPVVQQSTTQSQPKKQPVVQQPTSHYQPKKEPVVQQPTTQSQPKKQPTSHYQSKKEPVVQQPATQSQPKKQPTNQSQPKKQPTSHYQPKKELVVQPLPVQSESKNEDSPQKLIASSEQSEPDKNSQKIQKKYQPRKKSVKAANSTDIATK